MTVATRPGSNCRAWLAFGLAIALAVSSRAVHAGPAAAIPAECGSVSAFEAALRERLGPNASLDATSVTLTPDISGYRLVVEVAGERRELYDPNCQELMRAAVVIATAMLEPGAARFEAPRAAPETPPAPPLEPEDAAGAASAPRVMRVALGGAAGVHFGTVPNPTLLLELDAQLRWTRFGLAGGFRALLPATERDASGHGARVSGMGAYLAGTFQPWSPVQARLGVVGYRLSGTGLGSVERTTNAAWEFGPIVAASFTPFQRGPFWTNVGADGQLNVLRAHFEIDHYNDSVFRVPWLSGSLFLRVGVFF